MKMRIISTSAMGLFYLAINVYPQKSVSVLQRRSFLNSGTPELGRENRSITFLVAQVLIGLEWLVSRNSLRNQFLNATFFGSSSVCLFICLFVC